MKILVVSNLFPPEILGGYEILCHQVCLELRARGHQVSVLTTPSQESDTRSWVYRDLSLFLPFTKKPKGRHRLRQLYTYSRNRLATSRLLKRLQPELVFIWSQRRLTLASAQVAQEMGFPVAYSFNDEYLDFYRPYPLCGPMSTRSLNLENSTCISKILKENLVRNGLGLGPAQIIYQGIPLEKFPPREGAPSQLRRALYVGQLHPYKGVHTAIEAAQLCGVPLSIVGAGDPAYLERLQNLAQNDSTPINFLGKLSGERLSQIYRSHDVLLFPSEWQEPFGLTHLEAMASGTPVISTLNGGQAEFLEKEKNCLSFTAGNSVELAHQIQRFQHDPELLRRIALAGREVAREQFSLRRYLDDLESFLRGVA